MAAALALMLPAALASAQSAKPRVPPGGDPGGVAVAFIGPGVDYTRPEIARRLARDGEGELVGWDVLDNDRRPFERCDELGPAGPGHCATERARALLSSPGATRLIVLRASADEPQTLVRAFGLVQQFPTRIVLLSPAVTAGKPLDPKFLAEASARFPAHLLVVAATPSMPSPTPPNVIAVTALDAEPRTGPADVATPAQNMTPQRSEIAAARIAAIAARLLAAEPALDASALKQRIVALALPPPKDAAPSAPHGTIADPDKYPLR